MIYLYLDFVQTGQLLITKIEVSRKECGEERENV